MDSGLVSPTERAISSLPLKVIRVDWIRALKFRTSSFWLSKSTRKTVMFLNFGSANSLPRVGFWAWQVGHQDAWISTRIDLPVLWAARNACRVNGCSSAANAVADVNMAAAVAALRRNRRVIMANLAAVPDEGCNSRTDAGSTLLQQSQQRVWPWPGRIG